MRYCLCHLDVLKYNKTGNEAQDLGKHLRGQFDKKAFKIRIGFVWAFLLRVLNYIPLTSRRSFFFFCICLFCRLLIFTKDPYPTIRGVCTMLSVAVAFILYFFVFCKSKKPQIEQHSLIFVFFINERTTFLHWVLHQFLFCTHGSNKSDIKNSNKDLVWHVMGCVFLQISSIIYPFLFLFIYLKQFTAQS